MVWTLEQGGEEGTGRWGERTEPGGEQGGFVQDRVRLGVRLVRTFGACLEAGVCMPFRPGTQVLSEWSKSVLAALRVRVEVVREGGLQEGIILANHVSWLDPLAIMSAQICLPLAKAEVATYPGLGFLARRVGLRFVQRESASDRFRALRQVRRDLEAGNRVLLFPEGTTTDGRRLAPLHRGGPGLAYRLGIPVQPVRISSPDSHYPWLGDESLGPHLRELMAVRNTRVRVEFRPPLLPAAFPNLSAWLEAVRHSLLPEYLHAF